MTDIPIPADVLKAARKVQRAIGADRPMLKLCMAKAPTCGCGSLCVARTEVIARALMADRAEQSEHMSRPEEALRIAFRKALADLPEIAPPEIAAALSAVHMQDEFLAEGKRLQRVHGRDAVAPRVEQECGAGAWSFMRQGIARALSEGSDAT